MYGMDIESTYGLTAQVVRFIGKSVALPGCRLIPGTPVKAVVEIQDKCPVIVDYTEIKHV